MIAYNITVPSDFVCPARSWKDCTSANEAEVVQRSIAFINYWNNSSITTLPEGTIIQPYEVIS